MFTTTAYVVLADKPFSSVTVIVIFVVPEVDGVYDIVDVPDDPLPEIAPKVILLFAITAVFDEVAVITKLLTCVSASPIVN